MPTPTLVAVPPVRIANQLVVVPHRVAAHLTVRSLQEDAAPVAVDVGETVPVQCIISVVAHSSSQSAGGMFGGDFVSAGEGQLTQFRSRGRRCVGAS